MASPLIGALKSSEPEASVFWLVEPHLVDLLKCDPHLEDVIMWPKKQWVQFLRTGRYFSFFKESKRLRKQLKGIKFDLAIDAQGLLRSRILACLSGATERVGFSSREPGGSLMSRIISRGPHSSHMSSEYRYLMEQLGVDCGEFSPKIYVSSQDESTMMDTLQSRGIVRYTVLAPFTTRPQKHWFEGRWAELAGRIVDEFQHQIVILGGKSDQMAAKRLSNLSSVPLHDFTGKTTLGQAVAAVKHSSLLIGVDTGLTHLGTAFNRPTIALFGSTCPYLQTSNPRCRVLYHALPCSPCRRSPTCGGDFTCMKLLDTDHVMNAANEFFR